MAKGKGKEAEKTTITIEDANQAAFFSLRNCEVIPSRELNGRVTFRVTGLIYEILGELQSNPEVKILDYINRLKAMRSMIFTLKGK